MALDPKSLEPKIRLILSAPGTDLTTISAKRVRKELLQLDSILTADLLKAHKDEVDAVIAAVFELVSAENDRVRLGVFVEGGGGEGEGSNHRGQKRPREEEVAKEPSPPPPKKAKKAPPKVDIMSDAELARQLSYEINGNESRTRRGNVTGKGRGTTSKPPKKSRVKKSAEMVNSDEDDSDVGSSSGKKVKPKRKPQEGGAKGGFQKELTLSDPLANLLRVEKLPRTQVVKKLWEYIKENDMQNPADKREILCDAAMKAVFNTDKLNMFKMNKILGQHLQADGE